MLEVRGSNPASYENTTYFGRFFPDFEQIVINDLNNVRIWRVFLLAIFGVFQNIDFLGQTLSIIELMILAKETFGHQGKG